MDGEEALGPVGARTEEAVEGGGYEALSVDHALRSDRLTPRRPGGRVALLCFRTRGLECTLSFALLRLRCCTLHCPPRLHPTPTCCTCHSSEDTGRQPRAAPQKPVYQQCSALSPLRRSPPRPSLSTCPLLCSLFLARHGAAPPHPGRRTGREGSVQLGRREGGQGPRELPRPHTHGACRQVATGKGPPVVQPDREQGTARGHRSGSLASRRPPPEGGEGASEEGGRGEEATAAGSPTTQRPYRQARGGEAGDSEGRGSRRLHSASQHGRQEQRTDPGGRWRTLHIPLLLMEMALGERPTRQRPRPVTGGRRPSDGASTPSGCASKAAS